MAVKWVTCCGDYEKCIKVTNHFCNDNCPNHFLYKCQDYKSKIKIAVPVKRRGKK